MFLNRSPRFVPISSASGNSTSSTTSSSGSARAFMLKLILPSLIPMTLAETVSPSFNTSEGDLIRFSEICEICTSPESPFGSFTKAP